METARGLDAVLYLDTLRIAKQLGYEGGEISWTLEDNDLVNRVMADYDATTNPQGGANWEYIAANLKLKGTNDPTAIAPSWTKTMDGVKVGFVGAVTEHLPELVSPAGIANIDVTDIVTAVNTEADKLKAGGALLWQARA